MPLLHHSRRGSRAIKQRREATTARRGGLPNSASKEDLPGCVSGCFAISLSRILAPPAVMQEGRFRVASFSLGFREIRGRFLSQSAVTKTS